MQEPDDEPEAIPGPPGPGKGGKKGSFLPASIVKPLLMDSSVAPRSKHKDARNSTSLASSGANLLTKVHQRRSDLESGLAAARPHGGRNRGGPPREDGPPINPRRYEGVARQSLLPTKKRGLASHVTRRTTFTAGQAEPRGGGQPQPSAGH